MLIVALLVTLLGRSMFWYNHFYASICLYGAAATGKMILIHTLAKNLYYGVSGVIWVTVGLSFKGIVLGNIWGKRFICFLATSLFPHYKIHRCLSLYPKHPSPGSSFILKRHAVRNNVQVLIADSIC